MARAPRVQPSTIGRTLDPPPPLLLAAELDCAAAAVSVGADVIAGVDVVDAD